MLQPDIVLGGRYRVVRKVGGGGMGTVYEASDERLGTVVALKECHFQKEDEELLRQQFEREAKILAKLQHPAMTRVIDHFKDAERQFLVMDFVEGVDLGDQLGKQGQPFEASRVLAWADQLLDALEYLHGQTPPIIHRDIKPQNLKLKSRDRIVLLDFGLAKDSAPSPLTESPRSFFGYTAAYAPLEQMRGTGTDHRSDLFSLAATLYHLMSGTKPIDAMARATVITDGRPDPLVTPEHHDASIPSGVRQVLLRAMAMGKNQRYASASEMRRALSTAWSARESSTPTAVLAAEASTIVLEDVGTQPKSVPLASTIVQTPPPVDQLSAAATSATVPVTSAKLAPLSSTVRNEPQAVPRRSAIVPVSLGVAVFAGVVWALYGGLARDSSTLPENAAISPTPTSTASVSPNVESTPDQMAVPPVTTTPPPVPTQPPAVTTTPTPSPSATSSPLATIPKSETARDAAARLARAQRYSEAAEAYRAALQSEPADIVLTRGLADMLIRLENWKEAAVPLRKLGLLAPSDSVSRADLQRVLIDLGIVQTKERQFTLAEATYREVIGLNATNGVALNNLAYLLIENLNRPDDGVQLAKRALAVSSNDANYLDTLGAGYLKLNMLDEAKTPLERARTLSPRNSEVCDHVGELYFRLKRFKDAADAWQASLSGDGKALDIAAVTAKRDRATAAIATSTPTATPTPTATATRGTTGVPPLERLTLTGVVKDRSGAALPGVVLTLEEAQRSSTSRSALPFRVSSLVSDVAGRFSAPNLTPGRYRLSLTLAGFAAIEETIDLDRATPAQTFVMHQGYAATSDAKGEFSIRVEAGTYDVAVSLQGFRSFKCSGVRVDAVSGARIDAVLKIGSLNETTVLKGKQGSVSGRTIRGTVKDGDGLPIPGAAIVVVRSR